MATLKPANDINEGDLIQDRRGGAVLYVHEIERAIGDDKRPYVKSFITLPVTSEENAPSGSVTLPIEEHQIRDRSGRLNLPRSPAIAVGINVRGRLVVAEDHHMANYLAKISPDLVSRVNEKYAEIGAAQTRISELGDDVSIRGRDYSIITGPVFERRGADEESIRAPRKSPAKKKAASLVMVADMYLEDAMNKGFITEETYKVLAQRTGNSEVATLREALTLVQSDDKRSLIQYLKGESFDEAFPVDTRSSMDDSEVSKHPLIKKAEEIALDDARERGLLGSDFTLSVLTMPDGEDLPPEEDDFDERVMFTLDEAIRTVVIDPEYLKEEYHSPKGRKLTAKQYAGVIEDIKGAFNTLGQQEAVATQVERLQRISTDVANAYSQLIQNSDVLRHEGKLFMRHDPALPVAPKIEEQYARQLADIRRNRPPRFDI